MINIAWVRQFWPLENKSPHEVWIWTWRYPSGAQGYGELLSGQYFPVSS